jgi:hypothetical protein
MREWYRSEQRMAAILIHEAGDGGGGEMIRSLFFSAAQYLRGLGAFSFPRVKEGGKEGSSSTATDYCCTRTDAAMSRTVRELLFCSVLFCSVPREEEEEEEEEGRKKERKKEELLRVMESLKMRCK